MKKILYFLMFTVFFATSCEDFLEEVPKSTISPVNFYTTQEDALSAVNAAYAGLQPDGYYGRYMITSSIHASDGGYTRLGPTSDRAEIIFLNDAGMLSSNRYNITLWNTIWEAVNRANAVLDNVPNIEMDEDLKARILAEAKFLRGLSYFNMVRRWGGVPIVLNETSSSDIIALQVSRNTKDEVYVQIEKDLSEAMADLPNLGDYSDSDVGRASKEAAQGLLAKAQLYQKKWATAKTNAVAVIESPSALELVSEPKDLWWESDIRDNNSESIFEVQYNGDPDNNGHALSNNFEPRNNGWGPGQWGSIHANLHFYNKFSDNDKRKAATFLTSHPEKNTDTIQMWWNLYPTPAHSPHIAKHREPYNFTRCTYNVKILRLADILLVAAEACNETDDKTNALEYVNRIRRRAGLTPDLTSALSKEALRDTIYLEVRRELCYEGQDYEELVRTGKLISEKEASGTYTLPIMYESDGITIHVPDQALIDDIENYQPQVQLFELDDHNTLWPIPQPTMDANPNMVQNPGYN